METTASESNDMKIPVLIVGAGPVGLALAAELGRLGIKCLLVEQGDGTINHPRASELNARTMEFCRRWGVADKVRAAGTPKDFPNAALFVTSYSGHELARITRPGHAEDRDFPNGPERPKRCNQLWFDPILADYVAGLPSVTRRMNCRFESFTQDSGSVSVVLRDMVTGKSEMVEADYLVACCGGHSAIPSAIGVTLDDTSILDHSVNIFIRAPSLWDQHDKGAASLNFFIDDEGLWGGMSAQNGRDLWRLTVHGPRDLVARAEADVDACLERMFGGKFEYEVISVVTWTRRSWVAEKYAEKRVFLAGDSAHQCSPTGGFGLNTGMGDAMDLAWKLAATLQGWGGDKLLASYDAERRPIGRRNIREATDNYMRYEMPDTRGINDDTAEGAALRDDIGRVLRDTRARQFLSEGLALGYRYDPSPICRPDDSMATPDEISTYVPSARPGGRAPHFNFVSGSGKNESILDAFGDGFVVLLLGDDPPDAGPLTEAAGRRGVPLRIETIADPAARELYECSMVLVRPDGHVAWRGNGPPENPLALLDLVRGAG